MNRQRAREHVCVAPLSDVEFLDLSQSSVCIPRGLGVFTALMASPVEAAEFQVKAGFGPLSYVGPRVPEVQPRAENTCSVRREKEPTSLSLGSDVSESLSVCVSLPVSRYSCPERSIRSCVPSPSKTGVINNGHELSVATDLRVLLVRWGRPWVSTGTRGLVRSFLSNGCVVPHVVRDGGRASSNRRLVTSM